MNGRIIAVIAFVIFGLAGITFIIVDACQTAATPNVSVTTRANIYASAIAFISIIAFLCSVGIYMCLTYERPRPKEPTVTGCDWCNNLALLECRELGNESCRLCYPCSNRFVHSAEEDGIRYHIGPLKKK